MPAWTAAMVADLVVLHKVNAMTEVLKRLKLEGIELAEDLLAGLSRHRSSHINLLGNTNCKTNKRAESLRFKL